MIPDNDLLTRSFGLHGRKLLITGASSGIGRQVALHCARAGATVTISGRDQARLDDVLTSLDGGGHSQIQADLSNDADIENLAKSVDALDGVVHCAGISALAPMRMVTRTHIQSQLDINLIAPMLVTRQLLARNRLQEGSSILFISSISAHIGVHGVTAYSASKAALEGMTRSLAMELARRNARVNCLAPGLVRTPMYDAAVSTTGGLEDTEAKYPLGIGTPEDIACAAVFFLAPASRWITGTVLVLDGGHTAG